MRQFLGEEQNDVSTNFKLNKKQDKGESSGHRISDSRTGSRYSINEEE